MYHPCEKTVCSRVFIRQPRHHTHSLCFSLSSKLFSFPPQSGNNKLVKYDSQSVLKDEDTDHGKEDDYD